MIDFRLSVFCSVARHLSFTKASKELLVSQPAISKHIQELEAAYGTRLFERMSSGISLTPSGKLLLAHAEKILRDYRQLDFEMNLLTLYPNEYLRLGASHAIIQRALSDFLSGFRERNNSIEVSLLCGSAQTIEEAVMKGEIGLGIIEIGTPQSGLRYTPFLIDELLRVMNYPLPLKGKTEFCFVQKADSPHDIASAFMRYLNHKI